MPSGAETIEEISVTTNVDMKTPSVDEKLFPVRNMLMVTLTLTSAKVQIAEIGDKARLQTMPPTKLSTVLGTGLVSTSVRHAFNELS